jgi:uncharacterized membrane protein YkoI
MQRTRKLIIAAAATALVAGGAGSAVALAGDDDGDRPATAAETDRAREAALAVTDGTVTDVERDVERGATWEVEVTKPDGQEADVRLDDRFGLVVVDEDREDDDRD